MPNSKIIKTLIEFFLEDFRQDPAGVGDWLAANDLDADEFLKNLDKLKEEVV